MIATVNVMQCEDVADFAINKLASFPDDEDGNTAAEALFTEWVLGVAAEPIDEETMNSYLDDGAFHYNDTQCIAIVHSTE